MCGAAWTFECQSVWRTDEDGYVCRYWDDGRWGIGALARACRGWSADLGGTRLSENLKSIWYVSFILLLYWIFCWKYRLQNEDRNECEDCDELEGSGKEMIYIPSTDVLHSLDKNIFGNWAKAVSNASSTTCHTPSIDVCVRNSPSMNRPALERRTRSRMATPALNVPSFDTERIHC